MKIIETNLKVNKTTLFFIITATLLVIDQISKFYSFDYFYNDQNQTIIINNFINLHLVFNKGVSFGLFSQFKYSTYFFLTSSSLITIYLIYYLYHEKRKHYIIPLIMIISGAIGNIIDRIIYQAVVDFIQLHYKDYFWPTFNFADSYIFIGVFAIIILDYKNANRK